MSAAGQLSLRLALAIVFVAHGAHKLFGLFAGPAVGAGGLDATAAILGDSGLGSSVSLAAAAGVAQFGGGLLIGIGLLTRWAAAVLAIYLIAGLWFVHLEWGFFLNWTGEAGRGHGVEYSIVLLGALLCLALSVPDEWSIDGHRASTAEARAAARARVRNKF